MNQEKFLKNLKKANELLDNHNTKSLRQAACIARRLHAEVAKKNNDLYPEMYAELFKLTIRVTDGIVENANKNIDKNTFQGLAKAVEQASTAQEILNALIDCQTPIGDVGQKYNILIERIREETKKYTG